MYRNSFEMCPRCAVELEDARSARGCRTCGGLWIGATVLTDMVLAMLPARPFARLAFPPMPRELSAGACPACGDAMEPSSIHAVELSRCAKHGIWFDRGNLEEVLRRVADPSRGAPLEELPESPSARAPALDGAVDLVLRFHDSAPREVRIWKPVITIGRRAGMSARPDPEVAGGVDVELDDPRASRPHAAILARSPRELVLSDLGGPIGTWLNHVRIHRHSPLRHGDAIAIGGTRISVTLAAR